MYNNLEVLKEQLEVIVQNEYEPTKNIKPFSLALKMLDIIGIEDSYIRDDLVYMVMCTWIMNDVFSTEELRKILQIIQDDNHMFYKLGEKDTNSVLTRSFSVLLMPVIIFKHSQSNFLSEDEILSAYSNVINYYEKEKDIRGYIKNNGWAHSAAHTADAIDEFVKLPQIHYNELKEVLRLIRLKVCISSYQYAHQEDERIVIAILSILERNIIPLEEIVDFVESFKDLEKAGVYPDDINLTCNVKHFLRSLYFRVLQREEYKMITNSICDTLSKLTPFHD